MNIWVDADACPVAIREIICKAAIRTEIPATFVANHNVPVQKSPLIKSLQVQSGFDIADDEIVQRCTKQDLVITSDIPLANDVLDKGAMAINVRGESYTKENIKAMLGMRDFMDTMRASGHQSKGPAPLDNSDKQRFANALDRILTKYQQQAK